MFAALIVPFHNIFFNLVSWKVALATWVIVTSLTISVYLLTVGGKKPKRRLYVWVRDFEQKDRANPYYELCLTSLMAGLGAPVVNAQDFGTTRRFDADVTSPDLSLEEVNKALKMLGAYATEVCHAA